MAKSKHYVVWVGRKPGIYDSWPETEAQVKGFSGARFKGFPSREAAVQAFQGKTASSNPQTSPTAAGYKLQPSGCPTGKFLTVDAAFSGKTHVLEWRGVLVEDGKQTEVFRSSLHKGGSANVGEYLAIVDGVRYLVEKALYIPLYSDSHNAQKWVRECQHRSNVSASPALCELLQKANEFLKFGGYKKVSHHIEIRDWKSREWGDVPADFGRK